MSRRESPKNLDVVGSCSATTRECRVALDLEGGIMSATVGAQLSETACGPNGRHRLRRARRGLLLSLLVVAPVLVVGGIALANIPDKGTGVFHGCYSTSTGALRVIDPSAKQACKTGEKEITWDQAGISWRGTWSSTTSYAVNDAVAYNGSSYIATTAGKGAVPPSSSSSWDTLASEGSTGLPGPDGTTILSGSSPPSRRVGANGDYFLDTATHVLYGPAVVTCTKPIHCSVAWGKGTSLVGPPGPNGPAGEGAGYVSYPDYNANRAVNIPGGEQTTIVEQTIPTAGSYEINADVSLYHSFSVGDVQWECQLFWANQGEQGNVLEDLTDNAEGGFSTTPMHLDGVATVEANADIFLDCQENSSKAHDEADFGQLISTQLSGVTVLP